ncbi:hypothetical protein AWB92_26690 [Mycobacterium sp. IEC1808]|nr:hypothetical protein AWB92_26690 [Mycobacterium sp. IEC1808]
MLLVLVLGTIARFWVWIVGALAIAVLFVALWRFAGRIDRSLASWEARRRARADVLAATAHRADVQNAQVLAGDDRGVYGDYPPSHFNAQTYARRTSVQASGIYRTAR